MEDPGASSFAEAMRLADFRTLSLLDHAGIVLTRVWCVIELFLTLIGSATQSSGDGGARHGLWATYTTHEHTLDQLREAVGIVEGGAPCDDGDSFIATLCERHFPMARLIKAIHINIEAADASVEEDKRWILHYIAGTNADSDAQPIQQYPKYKELNQTVAGQIAANEAVLQAAARGTPEEWTQTLHAAQASTADLDIDITFDDCDGWEGLSSVEKAVELIHYLPKTTKRLSIYFGNKRFAADDLPPLVEAVAGFVTATNNLTRLKIGYTNIGDGDVKA